MSPFGFLIGPDLRDEVASAVVRVVVRIAQGVVGHDLIPRTFSATSHNTSAVSLSSITAAHCMMMVQASSFMVSLPSFFADSYGSTDRRRSPGMLHPLVAGAMLTGAGLWIVARVVQCAGHVVGADSVHVTR